PWFPGNSLSNLQSRMSPVSNKGQQAPAANHHIAERLQQEDVCDRIRAGEAKGGENTHGHELIDAQVSGRRRQSTSNAQPRDQQEGSWKSEHHSKGPGNYNGTGRVDAPNHGSEARKGADPPSVVKTTDAPNNLTGHLRKPATNRFRQRH